VICSTCHLLTTCPPTSIDSRRCMYSLHQSYSSPFFITTLKSFGGPAMHAVGQATCRPTRFSYGLQFVVKRFRFIAVFYNKGPCSHRRRASNLSLYARPDVYTRQVASFLVASSRDGTDTGRLLLSSQYAHHEEAFVGVVHVIISRYSARECFCVSLLVRTGERT